MRSPKFFVEVWVVAAVYSVVLLLSRDFWLDQAITAGYCLYVTFWFLKIRRSIESMRISSVLCVVLAQHLGIIVGFVLADAPFDRLWVWDSYNLHIPGAVNVANALAGVEELRSMRNSFDRIYVTHFFVGIFFYFFGATPWVSSLALLVPKLGATFLTFKLGDRLFGSATGILAAAVYALLPTITFYTLVFYKEAFVHLFVLGVFYGLTLVRAGRASWAIHFGIVLSLGLIANERFYLFPLFLLSTFLVYGQVAVWTPIRIGMVTVATALCCTLFVRHFSDQIKFENLWAELVRFKNEYNAFSDVDQKWNAQLPYPIGVLKLYFSPYFHPRKFGMFSDYSLLLIWASFLSQIVLVGAALELFLRTMKTGWRRLLWSYGYVFIPFLGFMLVFGYVAPFAGRLRDMFVPLLALFFAHRIAPMTRRDQQQDQ